MRTQQTRQSKHFTSTFARPPAFTSVQVSPRVMRLVRAFSMGSNWWILRFWSSLPNIPNAQIRADVPLVRAPSLLKGGANWVRSRAFGGSEPSPDRPRTRRNARVEFVRAVSGPLPHRFFGASSEFAECNICVNLVKYDDCMPSVVAQRRANWVRSRVFRAREPSSHRRDARRTAPIGFVRALS